MARSGRDRAASDGVTRLPDPTAVVQLEAQHGQALFGFVRRLGLSDEHAADAVQEVLLRLWGELRAGRQVDNPKAWAYRSIYRLAMDEYRHRDRTKRLVAAIGGSTAPPSRDLADRIAVWEEVDRLPERQRHVMYLRYRSDLSFDDIGSILGITASAARSHATQAMDRLKRALGEREPSDG